MAAKLLGDVTVGSIVKINENGSPVDFYVAKHDYESGLNGTGRTLVVRKEVYKTLVKWHTSNVNAYATSKIDSWLNGTYKALLDDDIQVAIGSTEFYYTPGNGSNDVTTLSRAVFLLSATELGQSNGSAAVEGTALSIADIIKIAYLNNNVQFWWTRSPHTNNTDRAWLINKSGDIGYGTCTNEYGARPVFTLSATFSVSDDGTVIANTSPVITSGTASGADLGEKAEGFSLTYMADDADGDSITVSEYLDGVLKRSYAATPGVTNTFECVTAANYQKILNGTHTLKVVANDGKADSEAFTVTFSKKITSATVTLEEALDADDLISVMIATIVGSIPNDAELEVLVTNNANDSSPAWEDATASILAGENYVFSNKTAANGFAFNFRLSVSRGASDVGGYINSIGGAFQ